MNNNYGKIELMLHDVVFLGTGFVVGAMNAIAGGGMLVGFPILIALGIPPIIANATGGVVSAPGQLASAYGYRQYLRRVPKRYALLAIPSVLGAIGGALLLRNTAPGHFEKMVPVLVLLGVMMFAFQPLLHFHLHRHITTKSSTVLPLIFISLVLLLIAGYGAFFGPGYGFLMLAFLGFTNLPDAHMINAMKNVSASLVAGAAVVCLAQAHMVDWHTGIIMAAGAIIGGYISARSAQKLPAHWLRICVIVVGLSAVVYLGLREW